jgi:hypothetical protein
MARDRRRSDDEDDDLDRPRRSRKPADDDDDDAPPARNKARRGTDDDADDFDDEPRPKKKLKAKAKSNTGLIIGISVGALVLIGGVIALIFLLGGSGTPKKAFESFAKAAEKKDYATLYDGMDSKSQTTINGLLALMSSFDPKFSGKSGKELFVAVLTDSENRKGGIGSDFPIGKKITVLSEDVKGDRATLRIKDDTGREESVVMVKEDGKWKVSIMELMDAKMPKMPDIKMPKMPDFKMPDMPKMPDFKMPK